MMGQAFIDFLREPFNPDSSHPGDEESILLADAVEIADRSARAIISNHCHEGFDEATGHVSEWRDTKLPTADSGYTPDESTIAKTLSYLERRGLIERKVGEPQMIRFIGQEGS